MCLILLGTFANALPAQSQAPATKPSAPQELTAIASAGQVDLAWSAPANNGSSAILRYEVRGGRGTTVPDDRTWRSTGLGRTHVYGALTNGALYTFEVRAVNGEGDGSVAQIQATPATVPAAPHTLSATPAASRLVLRWSAPANASTSAIVRYEVRHAEGATVPANAAWTSAGLATTYNFTNLSNGKSHTFQVRAASEHRQGPAAQIQGTPVGEPAAPQRLSARAGNARTTLSWRAPADNGGSDILRYEVRHARGSSVPANKAWTEVGLAKWRLVTSLTNGALHSFEVRAANGYGAHFTARIQATPGFPPTVPQGLSAMPSDRQVVLRWSAPGTVGTSAIVRYEMRHAESATVPANTAWTSVGLVTTHTVTGLSNRASHSFEVRAVNGQGGGPAAQIQATPATKPSAPQELTARASAGRVSLAWSVPTDDGGSELLRYEIRHAKGAIVPENERWTELELYRTYYFAGLDNGEQYSFEVRAVNTIGPGSVAPIQATPGGPPTAPEDLSAAPGDRQAVLSWSAPENDGGSAVTGYEVRHALGTSVPKDTAWTSVGLVTTHTVIRLDNGKLHSFEVRAVSGRGAGRAARIQATPVTVPSAPQELTAVASAGRVDLAWSVPTDDGGSELLRYEIRHAKGASVPNDTAWTELELYRTYNFSGLDNGEQYSFEVRAVSVQGPGPAAPIQATPGGPPTAPESLSATPGDRQVVLQWERPASAGPSDVMNYEVRRAEGASVPENEQWFLVGIGTSTTQYGMTNGTLYTFEVRAVNVKAETGPAAQVQVTPVAKPTAPQGVAATTEDGGIVLRWSTPADNGGSEILRYEVRHAADVSVPEDKQWLSVGSSTSGTFSRLTNGALYTFEVRAVNAQGAGPAARIQVTPGLPNAPQSLSATPGNLRVTLNWDAPANNGGSGLLRYELRHANGTTVPTNTAWTTVGLITTHTVSGLANGTLRTFELRAVNQRGAGPAAKVQAAPSARPTAPLGISATPVRNRVDLQWSAPASTGGADILRYEARYAQGATIPDNTRWYSIALDTTTTFIPLLYNRLYTFQVRAVNRHGAGPAAQTSHAIGGLSTVSIAAGQATVTEGDDAKFLLNRTGSTESSMSVGINIRGHRKIMSAATRTLADNTGPLPDTTVSFGVGVSEVTLRLTTEADSVSEGDGEISATIAGSPDYEAGSAGSATVLVEDDDIPVVTLRWISPAMTLRNNVWVGSMVEGQDIEFGVECSGNTLAPDGRAPRIPLRRQELLNHPTVPEYGVDQLVRFSCNTRWQRSGQQRYVGPNNGLIEIDLHQQVLNLHDLSGYFSTLLNKCAPATDDVRFCPKFTFGSLCQHH